LGKLGRRHGLILFAGATGNGKTTTACSLLQEYLLTFGDVAITIEDPPELPLNGKHGQFGRCFQIRVENGDFGRAMSQTMRYNPRYILLGEIRTPYEASQALRAAINGHLVITTIHAGSIMEAINSLLKLVSGQENLELARGVLADGLAGVIYQKLMKSNKGKKPKLDFLFAGFNGSDAGVRSKIRHGKIEQLSTEVQQQATRVLNGKLPIGD
jgi:twitching motility protein PilT